jgi:hypothetical protein
MIDTTQLTQEQQWGLAFAAQQANATIEASNANLAEADRQPLFTLESYAEFVFRSACDSYYAQLIAHKQSLATERFNQLSPEEQAALLAQLQVPNVLQ